MPPLWVRASTAPKVARAAAIALLIAFYVVIYFSVAAGPDRVALRPINLLILLVAGWLFGIRGGIAVGGLLAALNAGLYLHDGVFLDTPSRMAGNLLSIVAGIVAGAVVGQARDLTLALREEVEKRRQAELRKEELTRLLVHDLKNPLAAILGHSALVREEEMGPEDVKDSAEAIYRSADVMKRMVLNLLDIGRAEDGQLRPRLTEIDLNALAEEVKWQVERQLAERHQQLQVVTAPEGGKVIADAELIQRLLMNLVDNAIKYTPMERSIAVAVKGDPDGVELSVRDEGPGIPAGFEEKIFDKYVRLDRDSETAAAASRGLGLTFCRLAAEVHGGRIWVEPANGHGSVFRVRLPRRGPQGMHGAGLPGAPGRR